MWRGVAQHREVQRAAVLAGVRGVCALHGPMLLWSIHLGAVFAFCFHPFLINKTASKQTEFALCSNCS